MRSPNQPPSLPTLTEEPNTTNVRNAREAKGQVMDLGIARIVIQQFAIPVNKRNEAEEKSYDSINRVVHKRDKFFMREKVEIYDFFLK